MNEFLPEAVRVVLLVWCAFAIGWMTGEHL